MTSSAGSFEEPEFLDDEHNDKIKTETKASSFEEPELVDLSHDKTLQELLCPDDASFIDFDAVHRRVLSHPRDALKITSGKTALQLAVAKHCPYTIVAAIIDAHPRATVRSAYSTSALFDACRHNSPSDIISHVLQSSIKQREKEGLASTYSPFTWINDIQVSIEQAQLLLDIHPAGAIEHDDYLGGINALNHLIDDFDWMIHDVSAYPHCNGTRNDNLDVLYQKLQMLLLAKDRSSNNKYSIAKKPSNSDDFRPLHCLLRYCLYEETTRTENSCNGYDFQGFVVAVTFIAKVDPEQFSARDANGNLALHTITNQKQDGAPASDEMETLVRVVLDAYPRAVLEKDRNGRLPLHLAASNPYISPACSKVLFQAAPQVLTMMDPLSGMYAFQSASIAASKGENSGSDDITRLDLVHKMLLGAPHVLSHDIEINSTSGSSDSDDDLLENHFACENLCFDCKGTFSEMKKELEELRAKAMFLERENMKLKGTKTNFGSPLNVRKRSKNLTAWI